MEHHVEVQRAPPDSVGVPDGEGDLPPQLPLVRLKLKTSEVELMTSVSREECNTTSD